MKRWIALFVLALAILFANVHTYGVFNHALNAGVTIGQCGVEIKGTPGVFCTENGGM
jgi:hypothetical protein